MSDVVDAPGSSGTASSSDQAADVASGMLDKGAPWKKGMSWTVVLVEGVILTVAGAFLVLSPTTSADRILIVLGAFVLLSACLSTFRLIRGQVAPERRGLIGFRSGAGLATGLVVVLGGLYVGESAGVAETVALAVILGVGLVLYGLAFIVGSFVATRQPEARFPIVGVILAVALALIGVLMIFQANGGIESLKGTFQLMGVIMLVAGVVLIGWSLRLRQHQTTDADV
jgi:uncharacterized membrane protein HdeD (DUF308 family)